MAHVVWSDPETEETRYDWTAIEAAAKTAGIDPEALKDWTFDGVTETLTADELIAGYKSYLEAEAQLQTEEH